MADGDGAQLVELFEKASKAAERAASDGGSVAAEEGRCRDALKAMGALPVSTSLLMSTQVGKRLRKLTKHPLSNISVAAHELLEAWKKVVAAEAASKNGASNGVSPSANRNGTSTRVSPSASKNGTSNGVSPSASKNGTSNGVSPSPSKSPSSKPGTPARTPGTTFFKKEKVTQVRVETTVKKVESKNVTPPVSEISSSSNGYVPPKLGKIPKAGDATRDRVRELMAEALAKVCAETTDDAFEAAKATDPTKVAVAVETAMFTTLGSSKGNAKYRSIMFNMKDENNPDFRRRVLLGEIKPEAIPTMNISDMASDQRKKENDDIKAKALFECERGLKQLASTDQFKCHKCGQRKTTYFQMQTRSADEPMTTFVTCVNCNAHWKFC